MRYKALRIENDKNIVTFNYAYCQLFSLKPKNYDVAKMDKLRLRGEALSYTV